MNAAHDAMAIASIAPLRRLVMTIAGRRGYVRDVMAIVAVR